jgi:hypothetical protein
LKLAKIAAGLSKERFDGARVRSEQLGNVAGRQALAEQDADRARMLNDPRDASWAP